MADWRNVEFDRRLRLRRAQDFLPILADYGTFEVREKPLTGKERRRLEFLATE